MLGSGQYDDETNSGDWHWETAEWRDTPRLRSDLYITYADGTEQLITSDNTWKVSTAGPLRYDNYYNGETYDARKEIPNWDKPSFDASAWSPVRSVAGPTGVLTAQKQPATKIVATWPAGTRTDLTAIPRVSVWNTGQARSGWATISVYGAAAGTPIQVLYGDKLNTNGTITNSGFTANGQIQTDIYISNGTGTAATPEVFAPQFTLKGHQYIQISSPSSPANQSGGTPVSLPVGVTVDVLSVQEVRTPMAPTGTFSAANPLLNSIESYVRAAIAENYFGGITSDTPIYEKDPWTGDAQLSAPTASVMFDTETQFVKDFQDMVDNAVATTGEVSLLAPTNTGYGYVGQTFKSSTNAGATPIWDAFWFVVPWESYMRYGDVRGLQMTYPMMKKYLDTWMPMWTIRDGDAFNYTLTSGLGDWDPATGANGNAAEGTNVNNPTIISPSSTAYYAYMAKIAAQTASALGNAADAAHFNTVVANIKADFNAKWWDASVGYYRENSTQIFSADLPGPRARLRPRARRRAYRTPGEARQRRDGDPTRPRRGRHRRVPLDPSGPVPGGLRGYRRRSRRGVRDRQPDHLSELRLLGRPRLDIARRILGAELPDSFAPHVRRHRPVVLREPGRYPAPHGRVREDPLQAHRSRWSRQRPGVLPERPRHDLGRLAPAPPARSGSTS